MRWSRELKWAPVDTLVILFTTYPRCLASRYLRGLPVSPIYLVSLQFVFWHSIIYIMFLRSYIKFIVLAEMANFKQSQVLFCCVKSAVSDELPDLEFYVCYAARPCGILGQLCAGNREEYILFNI